MPFEFAGWIVAFCTLRLRGKNVKMEVKKNPNSDEHGGREVWGEVGTCNKAEMRLWREMQVKAAGELQPCG